MNCSGLVGAGALPVILGAVLGAKKDRTSQIVSRQGFDRTGQFGVAYSNGQRCGKGRWGGGVYKISL